MAKLLFFGKLQDVVGKSLDELTLPAGVTSTADLRAYLERQWELPDLFSDKTIRIAINNEFASEPSPLKNSDEIAFLPPVGGG